MKKTVRIISIAIVSYFLSLGNVGAGENDFYDTSQDAIKIGWMRKGISAVKTKLRDSDAAKFRGVHINRGRDGISMICGEVNAKNAFGGYIGYQKFVSNGKTETTYLQEEVQDFYLVWKRFCE